MRPPSWLEASARERVASLLDPGSFVEILGPEMRETSPHLALFDLPVAFDDGVIAGSGSLAGRRVLVAAQEGRFMGGTFGEVSGAKIVGLLRAAMDGGPDLVLLALDSGGVRLQEANAGELAISETARAIIEARARGVQVIALVGGRSGAFGGAGIIAACCARIVISQHGRTGVTGPEVIETNKGVEEFDSRDRSLVWRITGGRTRCLLGGADRYVRDEMPAFREAAVAISDGKPLDLETLRAEHDRLRTRLASHGEARDATAIWTENIAELDEDGFMSLFARLGEPDVAR